MREESLIGQEMGLEPIVLTYRARTLSICSCIFLGSWGEVQTLTPYSTGVKVLRVYQFHHPAIIPYPKTLFISEVKPIWCNPILAVRFSWLRKKWLPMKSWIVLLIAYQTFALLIVFRIYSSNSNRTMSFGELPLTFFCYQILDLRLYETDTRKFQVISSHNCFIFIFYL